MKNKKNYTDGLHYDTICKAVNGDENAEAEIFEHYEPYIIQLAKIPFYDEEGNLKYKIDEDIYMCLKLKLHEVILKFEVA